MVYIFIDRDGVINKDPGGWTDHNYVTDWKDFHFIPGSLEALKILKEKGIKVIVISNQAGVNKGYYSIELLNEISNKMLAEIKNAGGSIKEVFYCVHTDEENCDCRKPKAGLLKIAAKKYGIDPKRAYFIGDGRVDLQAGKKFGCKTVLLLSGKSSREEMADWEERPDYVFKDLLEAAQELVKDKL